MARVPIAAATLLGNSLRQTVHNHCASIYQAAKLVAALLRVSRVTAGLAESNASLPPGLWLTSPAGWLPRTGISSGTLRSVINQVVRELRQKAASTPHCHPCGGQVHSEAVRSPCRAVPCRQVYSPVLVRLQQAYIINVIFYIRPNVQHINVQILKFSIHVRPWILANDPRPQQNSNLRATVSPHPQCL